MQGVFNGTGYRFPTKKSLKEAAKRGDSIHLEATSLFGNEYDGTVRNAPDGRYAVVGPDPYRKRNWYATITVADGLAVVT